MFFMPVEICDTWYYTKIVFPKEGGARRVKCLMKRRVENKVVMVVDKKSPSKWGRIVLKIIRRFGVKVDEHEWVGYSQGSRMLAPGIRRRKHEVYLLGDKVLMAITMVVVIKGLKASRYIPEDRIDSASTINEVNEILRSVMKKIS